MRRTIMTSSTRFFFSNYLSMALFALALIVGVSGLTPAWAATILVQSGADDGTAVPGNCPGANCRLRDAIASAVAGDVLQFANDYTIPIANNPLAINKNLTIDGVGHSIILNGPGASCGGSCPLLVVGNSDSSATLTLNNLTLTDGYGRDAGGAILNYATILLNNCAFSDNYSDDMGGAIYNFGTATIANSTFVNNTAQNWGGAIMNSGVVWSGANVTISNSTFVGNTATTGSNLATWGTGGAVGLMLRNTLVANPLGGGANCYTEGSALTDGGHNLDDGASCGFAAVNGSLNNTNPQLGAFSNYGGGTQTLALLSGSPAIGAGDNTVCAAAPVNGNDQRGITRDTACDIGAFEVETSQTGPAFTVNIAADHNGDICSDDDCTLREAINTANTLSGANTITFAGSYTIALASELSIESELTIDGAGHTVTVSGNDTTRVFTIAASEPVHLNDVNIVNGNSSDDNGSGILNNSPLTVTNSTFSGNNASGLGGGILSTGPLTIANSTFSGNTAGGDGGGIANFAGTLAVTNSTFSGNSASGAGGGIASIDALTVTNSTFSGNSAGEGSDISTLGSVTLRNTVLANSAAGDHCYKEGDTATFIDGGGNLEDGASCGFSQPTSLNNTNPLLDAPGNYGGSTETLPLLPGSPAMNATTANCPATDQRGVTRGTTCDSGAFESQGFTLTKTGGDNQTTLISTAFANPLAVSVTSAFSEPVNGGYITFTPPGSGASAVITGSPATISDGAVSVTATANATIGAYTVTASATGATSVNFALTNTVFYTLTYKAGAGGTISGASPQTVAYGASGTPVTAEPNTGYHFAQWSDGVLTALRTDTNVTKDIIVTAEFEADQPSGNSYLLWTK